MEENNTFSAFTVPFAVPSCVRNAGTIPDGLIAIVERACESALCEAEASGKVKSKRKAISGNGKANEGARRDATKWNMNRPSISLRMAQWCMAAEKDYEEFGQDRAMWQEGQNWLAELATRKTTD